MQGKRISWVVIPLCLVISLAQNTTRVETKDVHSQYNG